MLFGVCNFSKLALQLSGTGGGAGLPMMMERQLLAVQPPS
jgi:hypothetical protein